MRESILDEDIDGVALMGLQDDDILKLLSILDEDGTVRSPKLRIQRKFKTILDAYNKFVEQERKKHEKSKLVWIIITYCKL